MLDSVLLLLSATAGILLVPAIVALLGVEKHRHLAQSESSSRRAGVAGAATVIGLSALGLAALLGAEAVPALAVAVALCVSVLVWSPLSTSWAVRGVVVWALLVTGVLAFLGWLLQQIWVSSMSAGERVASMAGWLLLLLAVTRLQHYVRPVIGAQAGLVPGVAVAQQIPTLRPVLSLAALLAAIGLVVAVTAEDMGPADEGQGPEAGRGAGSQTIAGTSSIRPSRSATADQPADQLTSMAAPTRTQGPGAADALDGRNGTGGATVAGAGDNVVAGVYSGSGSALVPPGASCPTTGPAKAGDGRSQGGKVRSVSGPAGGGAGAPGPSRDGTGSQAPSAGARPAPGTTGADVEGPTTAGPVPAYSPAPARTAPPKTQRPTRAPVKHPQSKPSPVVTAIGKALGHQKSNEPGKPESRWLAQSRTYRPATAPSPGRRFLAGDPTVYPGPRKPSLSWHRAETQRGLDAWPTEDKTYGYEKEKPNRPAHAPSPGHGRPTAS